MQGWSPDLRVKAPPHLPGPLHVQGCPVAFGGRSPRTVAGAVAVGDPAFGRSRRIPISSPEIVRKLSGEPCSVLGMHVLARCDKWDFDVRHRFRVMLDQHQKG